jgi:hypothetical protein
VRLYHASVHVILLHVYAIVHVLASGEFSNQRYSSFDRVDGCCVCLFRWTHYATLFFTYAGYVFRGQFQLCFQIHSCLRIVTHSMCFQSFRLPNRF